MPMQFPRDAWPWYLVLGCVLTTSVCEGTRVAPSACMKLYRIFGALSLLSLVALPACGAQRGADDESDSDQGPLKTETDAGGGTAAVSPVTKRFAGSLTVGSTELKVELSATASAPSTSAAKVARDNDSHV